MENSQIQKPKGSTTRKKIVGRGNGSGYGKTAGKGTKGQNSRSGGGVRPGFEGGQMPLYRRIARRGFSNYPFKKEYTLVDLESLNVFDDGQSVDRAALLSKGLLDKPKLPIKVLGNGNIKIKIKLSVDKVTSGAREKIEQAGGTVDQGAK